MFVIRSKFRQMADFRSGEGNPTKRPTHFISGRNSVLQLLGLAGTLIFSLALLQSPAYAAGAFGAPPIRSLAQIKIDDEGKPLTYPSALAYDRSLEEIYVVNGGSSRLVVYGPDYFPKISIGVGRGILSPTAVAVADNGEVYVCQVRTRKNPSPRITILNGAFFIDREILLDQIPEAKGFIPKGIALNRDFIYLAGENSRGVMVLDLDGTFLRWIKPVDQIYARNLPVEEPVANLPEEPGEEGQEAPTEKEELYADIPEEFRPRTSEERSAVQGSEKVEGPVVINFVTLDNTGRLYLISNETGKVYVYGPDESFLFSFGTKGGSPGQMSQPRALGIDEKQDLVYVADYMRHTILVYHRDGEYLFEVGGRGLEPGWFNFPTAMVLNKHDQFIVADLFNGRVQVLDMAYQEWLRQYEIEQATEEEKKAEELPIDSEFLPGRGEAVPETREPDPGTGADSSFEVQLEEGPDPDIQVEEEIIQEEEIPSIPLKLEGGDAAPDF